MKPCSTATWQCIVYKVSFLFTHFVLLHNFSYIKDRLSSDGWLQQLTSILYTHMKCCCHTLLYFIYVIFYLCHSFRHTHCQSSFFDVPLNVEPLCYQSGIVNHVCNYHCLIVVFQYAMHWHNSDNDCINIFIFFLNSNNCIDPKFCKKVKWNIYK